MVLAAEDRQYAGSDRARITRVDPRWLRHRTGLDAGAAGGATRQDLLDTPRQRPIQSFTHR
jgi:hypothetical protein